MYGKGYGLTVAGTKNSWDLTGKRGGQNRILGHHKSKGGNQNIRNPVLISCEKLDKNPI